MSFGLRLKIKRLTAGLKQGEMALRCGMRQARLSRIENGHVVPSELELAAILRELPGRARRAAATA